MNHQSPDRRWFSDHLVELQQPRNVSVTAERGVFDSKNSPSTGSGSTIEATRREFATDP
jgi:hypothetical protein